MSRAARPGARGTVAVTARGPIEYALSGSGTPVLVLHGSPAASTRPRRWPGSCLRGTPRFWSPDPDNSARR
jgi:hypothetical protein